MTTTNSTWTTRQQHKLGIMLGRTWKTRISTCSEDNDTARCCFRAWAHPRSQLVSGAKKKTTQLFALTFEVVMDLISAPERVPPDFDADLEPEGPATLPPPEGSTILLTKVRPIYPEAETLVVGALRRTAGHGWSRRNQ